MQLSKTEVESQAWNCVIDAIAFTNWRVYLAEGVEYLPAPIENVDEELIGHFIDNYSNLFGEKDIVSMLEFINERSDLKRPVSSTKSPVNCQKKNV